MEKEWRKVDLEQISLGFEQGMAYIYYVKRWQTPYANRFLDMRSPCDSSGAIVLQHKDFSLFAL